MLVPASPPQMQKALVATCSDLFLGYFVSILLKPSIAQLGGVVSCLVFSMFRWAQADMVVWATGDGCVATSGEERKKRSIPTVEKRARGRPDARPSPDFDLVECTRNDEGGPR